tara:strand:+ start:750 stop:1049 length:300 start_codon:yes stop_codon:yes gene_type:complete
MTNNPVKTIIENINQDYHDFLNRANALAHESLVNKNVEYRFYEKSDEEQVDFDNPKISTGKITNVVVTSDNDILFDIVDNKTLQKHIMFSCDILNVKGQ